MGSQFHPGISVERGHPQPEHHTKYHWTHLLGHGDIGAALGGVVLRGRQVHDLGPAPDQLADQEGEVLFWGAFLVIF